MSAIKTSEGVTLFLPEPENIIRAMQGVKRALEAAYEARGGDSQPEEACDFLHTLVWTFVRDKGYEFSPASPTKIAG